jgi:hypothetical protein
MWAGQNRERNATKAEYCTRAPRTELTGALQADPFGTPIPLEPGGVGRPKGGVSSAPVVPGRVGARQFSNAAK